MFSPLMHTKNRVCKGYLMVFECEIMIFIPIVDLDVYNRHLY